MIATLLKSSWLNLRRDYVALALTFVLPIAFFSIFAMIFANMAGGGSAMSNVDVAVVDEDDSEISRRLVEAIDEDPALDVRPPPAGEPENTYDREQARELVRDGTVRVAIIIPQGFGESFFTFSGDAAVVLLADTVADPVAHQMVGGLLQRAAMTAAPDLLAERGLDQFDKYVGMTDEQRTAIKPWLEDLRELGSTQESDGDQEAAETLDTFSGIVQVETSDVRALDEGDEKADNRRRLVAYYAAAIGVMFLLFSMAGAMSALLEEQRTGTLERLLNSNLTMGSLLAAYWVFAGLLGFLQITVMFVWGWAVFGLDLWTVNHVVGFAVMTAFLPQRGSASRHLDDRDPGDVGRGREHGPAVHHARGHAEGRARNLQRLGPGRLPQGLSRRRARVRAVAPGARADGYGRGLPGRGAALGPPLGNHVGKLGTVTDFLAPVFADHERLPLENR
jgi:ABC-2 type transport system permease protein